MISQRCNKELLLNRFSFELDCDPLPGIGYPAELIVLFGEPVNKRPEANSLNQSLDVDLDVFFNRRYAVMFVRVECFYVVINTLKGI